MRRDAGDGVEDEGGRGIVVTARPNRSRPQGRWTGLRQRRFGSEEVVVDRPRLNVALRLPRGRGRVHTERGVEQRFRRKRLAEQETGAERRDGEISGEVVDGRHAQVDVVDRERRAPDEGRLAGRYFGDDLGLFARFDAVRRLEGDAAIRFAAADPDEVISGLRFIVAREVRDERNERRVGDLERDPALTDAVGQPDDFRFREGGRRAVDRRSVLVDGDDGVGLRGTDDDIRRLVAKRVARLVEFDLDYRVVGRRLVRRSRGRLRRFRRLAGRRRRRAALGDEDGRVPLREIRDAARRHLSQLDAYGERVFARLRVFGNLKGAGERLRFVELGVEFGDERARRFRRSGVRLREDSDVAKVRWDEPLFRRHGDLGDVFDRVARLVDRTVRREDQDRVVLTVRDRAEDVGENVGIVDVLEDADRSVVFLGRPVLNEGEADVHIGRGEGADVVRLDRFRFRVGSAVVGHAGKTGFEEIDLAVGVRLARLNVADEKFAVELVREGIPADERQRVGRVHRPVCVGDLEDVGARLLQRKGQRGSRRGRAKILVGDDGARLGFNFGRDFGELVAFDRVGDSFGDEISEVAEIRNERRFKRLRDIGREVELIERRLELANVPRNDVEGDGHARRAAVFTVDRDRADAFDLSDRPVDERVSINVLEVVYDREKGRALLDEGGRVFRAVPEFQRLVVFSSKLQLLREDDERLERFFEFDRALQQRDEVAFFAENDALRLETL